jgi:hypothetical protein
VPPQLRYGTLWCDGEFAEVSRTDRQPWRMALSRKRRRRALPRWSEGPDDLHDYFQPSPKRRPSRRAPVDDGPIVVTDDWPEQVPIGDAELRIIESHLAKELDDLFGPLP